jgi:DNA replication protein DnaC
VLLDNLLAVRGYSTKYYRIPELILEIRGAKNENKYSKFMIQLQNIRLLILDDIGLKSYTLEKSMDILEVAESRYNKDSTILSGQISNSKWYELFPDAIMDRIVHNSIHDSS